MRIVWTLLKVIVGLAIAIPVGLVLLGLTVGLVGTVLRLAVVALKLACLALAGFGVFAVVRRLFGSRAPVPQAPRELPQSDRYYEAAMRELDAELGTRTR
ncbi:MAG: hypothetical protein ABI442_01765 [Gemmatimonadaceae bacterium]